ncbi:hypothetical protein Ddc_17378 [Ditylenchus destructor]|nr:hypothetical protein Ddc_17378 [Ditylenchus destructor]
MGDNASRAKLTISELLFILAFIFVSCGELTLVVEGQLQFENISNVHLRVATFNNRRILSFRVPVNGSIPPDYNCRNDMLRFHKTLTGPKSSAGFLSRRPINISPKIVGFDMDCAITYDVSRPVKGGYAPESVVVYVGLDFSEKYGNGGKLELYLDSKPAMPASSPPPRSIWPTKNSGRNSQPTKPILEREFRNITSTSRICTMANVEPRFTKEFSKKSWKEIRKSQIAGLAKAIVRAKCEAVVVFGHVGKMKLTKTWKQVEISQADNNDDQPLNNEEMESIKQAKIKNQYLKSAFSYRLTIESEIFQELGKTLGTIPILNPWDFDLTYRRLGQKSNIDVNLDIEQVEFPDTMKSEEIEKMIESQLQDRWDTNYGNGQFHFPRLTPRKLSTFFYFPEHNLHFYWYKSAFGRLIFFTREIYIPVGETCEWYQAMLERWLLDIMGVGRRIVAIEQRASLENENILKILSLQRCHISDEVFNDIFYQRVEFVLRGEDGRNAVPLSKDPKYFIEEHILGEKDFAAIKMTTFSFLKSFPDSQDSKGRYRPRAYRQETVIRKGRNETEPIPYSKFLADLEKNKNNSEKDRQKAQKKKDAQDAKEREEARLKALKEYHDKKLYGRITEEQFVSNQVEEVAREQDSIRRHQSQDKKLLDEAQDDFTVKQVLMGAIMVFDMKLKEVQYVSTTPIRQYLRPFRIRPRRILSDSEKDDPPIGDADSGPSQTSTVSTTSSYHLKTFDNIVTAKQVNAPYRQKGNRIRRFKSAVSEGFSRNFHRITGGRVVKNDTKPLVAEATVERQRPILAPGLVNNSALAVDSWEQRVGRYESTRRDTLYSRQQYIWDFATDLAANFATERQIAFLSAFYDRGTSTSSQPLKRRALQAMESGRPPYTHQSANRSPLQTPKQGSGTSTPVSAPYDREPSTWPTSSQRLPSSLIPGPKFDQRPREQSGYSTPAKRDEDMLPKTYGPSSWQYPESPKTSQTAENGYRSSTRTGSTVGTEAFPSRSGASTPTSNPMLGKAPQALESGRLPYTRQSAHSPQLSHQSPRSGTSTPVRDATSAKPKQYPQYTPGMGYADVSAPEKPNEEGLRAVSSVSSMSDYEPQSREAPSYSRPSSVSPIDPAMSQNKTQYYSAPSKTPSLPTSRSSTLSLKTIPEEPKPTNTATQYAARQTTHQDKNEDPYKDWLQADWFGSDDGSLKGLEAGPKDGPRKNVYDSHQPDNSKREDGSYYDENAGPGIYGYPGNYGKSDYQIKANRPWGDYNPPANMPVY